MVVGRIDSRDVVGREPAVAGIVGVVDGAHGGDVDQAREVLSAFDITRHPVQRLRDPAQHERTSFRAEAPAPSFS